MTPTIVHVMGWPSRQYGSFERFLVALSRRCAEAGIRTHLVFPHAPASDEFAHDVEAELHDLPSPRAPVDPRFALSLRRLFARVGATHLHAHFGIDTYHAILAARASGVAHRFTTKHIAPGFSRLTLSRSRHRWLAESVDRFFAVSARVARDLRALGIREQKIEVTYLGVDTAAYRPDPSARAALHEELGLAPEVRVVLSTSHLRPGKGVDLLPELAGSLDREPGSTCIVLAGDGPLAGELRGRARALGLGSDRFRLLGVRLDVPRLLAGADLYVFPTNDFPEGFGLSVLEAVAAGTPVVATTVVDLPELIGEAAYMVPPGEGAALVGACRTALSDPDVTSRREAGRRLVEERLSVERAAEQHVERYLAAS